MTEASRAELQCHRIWMLELHLFLSTRVVMLLPSGHQVHLSRPQAHTFQSYRALDMSGCPSVRLPWET